MRENLPRARTISEPLEMNPYDPFSNMESLPTLASATVDKHFNSPKMVW
jgi:hypothetical protein